MGSSGGANLQTPPRSPAPPAGQQFAMGGSPVNRQAYVNFLDPGMGMSSGFTPRIEADLARGYSLAPGQQPPGRPTGSPLQDDPLAGQQQFQMKLGSMPSSIAPVYQRMAQTIADQNNKNPSLAGYLSARDQLAQVMARAGGGGFTGGSSGGGNYGKSGRA